MKAKRQAFRHLTNKLVCSIITGLVDLKIETLHKHADHIASNILSTGRAHLHGDLDKAVLFFSVFVRLAKCLSLGRPFNLSLLFILVQMFHQLSTQLS